MKKQNKMDMKFWAILIATILIFFKVQATDEKLSLKLFNEDSVHKAKATLLTADDKPMAKAEVYFYIKRMFSLLPVQEQAAETDDNGEATIDFPATFRGDRDGNLNIIAGFITEDGDTTFATEKARWGVAFQPQEPRGRLLSASRSNAPIPLIIISNVIILSVWGVIIYMVMQLLKIKRKGKTINN
jgi:hypothetical protein